MRVKDLITYLQQLPENDIILADIGQKESAEITDVLNGNGTLKGFSYLKIEPYSE
jgi:hypothetical protein